MKEVEVEGVGAVGVARRPLQQQLRQHHPHLPHLHLPSLVGRYLLRSGGGRYYNAW